jgi:hypothetical protein
MDGEGIVEVGELALRVSARVRQVPVPTPQVPRLSARDVTGRIHLVRVPGAGPPPGTPDEPVAPPRTEPTGPPTLSALFGYYRDCLEIASTPMPLLALDELRERYLCVPGPERLLSNDLDGPGSVPVPEPDNDLYVRAQGDGATLWYGYPIVVLPRDRAGELHRVLRCAPLLIRPVEIVEGDSGEVLRSCGEITLHPGLIDELLDRDEAARDHRTRWRGGTSAQLIHEIDRLRSRLGLESVEPLDVRALEPSIDSLTVTPGLRNAAVVYVTQHDQQSQHDHQTQRGQGTPNAKILEDLAGIAAGSEKVRGTALAELLGPAASPAAVAVAAWTPVLPLPCNDGQRTVIDSAMTRRLTVATGPPGTGKTQLVVNLVATAVANGQKVLVTSSDNRTVDEVWRRCERLVPGALIRTGGSEGETDNAEHERNALARLAELPAPDSTEEVVGARLRSALRRLDEIREEAATKAGRERALLRLGRQRVALAEALPLSPGELRALLRGWNLRWVARRAAYLGTVRLLGNWRRRRFLRQLSWPGRTSPDVCAALGAWARNEAAWDAKRGEILGLRTDAELRGALAGKAEQVRQCSKLMLTTVVRQNAHRGRPAITDLLTAMPGADWDGRLCALSHVRGWATTNQGPQRRFATEPGLFDLVIVDDASQCSIPRLIPALYRAERALIVGDPMQLEPVINLGVRQETAVARDHRISASWLEGRRLNYRRHSAFHALATAAGGELVLDEHYRCHPEIAAIADAQFYPRGQTVLTDVHRQRRRPGPTITWTHVVGAARTAGPNSWYNEAEIELVDAEVRELLELLPPDADVGVVTRHREQRDRLARRWCHDPRVRVGTVQTFQGSEADAIVISLVAGPQMPSATLRCLGGERRLWNVAITRARSHLVLVGNRELWLRLGPIGSALVEASSVREQHRCGDRGDLDAELLDWLSAAHPRGRVSLSETVCGHRVDAVVYDGRLDLPVVLDRGHGADLPPSEHLRRQFELTRLITSDSGLEATRLPAWRLFDPRS